MAKALVDQVSERLAREFATAAKHGCETDRFALDYDETELEEAVHNLIQNSGFDAEIARHLVDAYGPGATKILEIAEENTELSSRIVPGVPYLMAEAVYAARYEMAMRLIDFMFRRTQLVYRVRDHGRSVVRDVANLMAKELGWSAESLENELTEFERECELVEPR